jgi:hypothetical protein
MPAAVLVAYVVSLRLAQAVRLVMRECVARAGLNCHQFS